MAAPAGLIVGWPSTAASIPAGWSRVTAYDDRYLRGAPAATNPGVNGGSSTHTHAHRHSMGAHTHSYTSGSASGTVTDAGAGGGSPGSITIHDHGNPTSGSTIANTGDHSTGTGSVALSHVRVIIIEADGTASIPAGALAWYNGASAPTNWITSNGVSGSPDMSGRYWRGAAAGGDGGGTGASSSHTHSVGSHTHTENSHTHTLTWGDPSNTGDYNAGSTTSPSASHGHGGLLSGSSASSSTSGGTNSGAATPEPPYLTLLPIYATSANDGSSGVIAGWDGALASIPSGWTLCDGSGTTVDLRDRYPKGDTAGSQTTGGSETHTHSLSSHSHTTTHTHSVDQTVSGTMTRGSGSEVINTMNHTHASTSGSASPSTSNVAVTEAADSNPPYRTIAWIQKLGDTHLAEGTLSGAGSLAVSGSVTRQGAISLDATGALVPAASTTLPGAAALSGAGSIAADATVDSIIKLGEAALGGAGSLTALGGITQHAAANLSVTGTLTAEANKVLVAAAVLAAATALTAAGLVVPRQRGNRLRVDVYDASGAKLAQGPLTRVFDARYRLAVDELGDFELRAPATDPVARLIGQGYEVRIHREGEGLVFRGLVDYTEDVVGPDGRLELSIQGASIGRRLVFANTLLGLNFTAETLANAVATLLAGTGWSAGTLATPSTVLEATFEGASIWAALLKVGQIFGLHVREDNLDEEVDVAALGADSGLTMQNLGNVSASIRENTAIVPLADLRVASESRDLWNSIIPHGAGDGINRLSLRWSDRSSPYTIQTLTGPDGETVYYLEDAASVSSYGRRRRVVVDTEAVPLANSTAGLTAAANALYDAAATYLARHAQPLVTYEARPVGLTHLDVFTGAPRFQVGEKLRLIYRGITVDAGGSARAWRSVDSNLWIMGFERRFGPDGEDDWKLALATVDRHTEDAARKIASVLEEVSALEVAKRPYTYEAVAGPLRQSTDSTHCAELNVNYRTNVYLLRSAHLYVTRKRVISNVQSAASGGGSVATSSSGGSSSPTSSTQSDHTHSVTGTTSTAGGSHRHRMYQFSSNANASTLFTTVHTPVSTAFESNSGGAHTHGMANHTHPIAVPGAQIWYGSAQGSAGGSTPVAYIAEAAGGSGQGGFDLYTHETVADHTHSVSGQTASAGGSHSHTVSIPAHTHDVSIPAHTHPITYGIFEGPSLANITRVDINGVDRTTALGGPWTADIVELDITTYLQTAGGEPLRQVNTVRVYSASLQDLIVEVKSLVAATSIVPV